MYWLNTDNDGYSIPYSRISGDAGEKIFFVFQRDPVNKNSEIATCYCRVDQETEHRYTLLTLYRRRHRRRKDRE